MSFPSNLAPPVPVAFQPAPPAEASPPRPANDWILFRADFCRLYKLRHDRDRSLNGTGLSGLASALWATYSLEEKKHWKNRAREASEIHAVLFPNYKYQPRRKGEKKEGKKTRGRLKKGKGGEEGSLRERTAGPSKGGRFEPYARPSSEDSGVVSEPVSPVDFNLSGVPQFTGPFEVAPSVNDTVYTLPPALLNAPMTFPPYTSQAPAPAQAYQPYAESAQAAMNFWSPTAYEQFQGPHDLPEIGSVPPAPVYSQEPQLNAPPPQDDDFSSIVPSIDVLDQFLIDHPEDPNGNFDLTSAEPVVENMWDYVNLDGFGSA